MRRAAALLATFALGTAQTKCEHGSHRRAQSTCLDPNTVEMRDWVSAGSNARTSSSARPLMLDLHALRRSETTSASSRRPRPRCPEWARPRWTSCSDCSRCACCPSPPALDRLAPVSRPICTGASHILSWRHFQHMKPCACASQEGFGLPAEHEPPVRVQQSGRYVVLHLCTGWHRQLE